MPGVSTSPDVNTNLQIMGADAYSADGAISIKNGVVAITKSTAAALTLAAPTAGDDDGKVLTILATTAQAHTVTTPANKINGASHIATFAAAVGNNTVLVAYQGVWYQRSQVGITLS